MQRRSSQNLNRGQSLGDSWNGGANNGRNSPTGSRTTRLSLDGTRSVGPEKGMPPREGLRKSLDVNLGQAGGGTSSGSFTGDVPVSSSRVGASLPPGATCALRMPRAAADA